MSMRLCALAAFAVSLGALPCTALISTWPGDALRHTDHPKTGKYGLTCRFFDKWSMQRQVTVIVSTSPRKEDSSGLGLWALKETITSIRNVLGLKKAHIVVAWDGLPTAEDSVKGAQVLNASQVHDYHQKLQDFIAWNKEELGGQATIFQNNEWTHQAGMLRNVFDFLKGTNRLTPLFYVSQDDARVSGNINVPFILRYLACDPSVDWVRFQWSDDCTEWFTWSFPCEQHNKTNMLHSVVRYSDRPHFAVATVYDEIFRKCEGRYSVPERCALPEIAHGWIYGKRHAMLHDTNLLHGSLNQAPKAKAPAPSR